MKQRSKTLDLFFLLGASLVVVVTGTAAFWFADEYHVNAAWLLGALAAALFFAVVGWGYRSKFRSPAFGVFFVVWMLLHVAIYLLTLGYLGLPYYIPVAVLELWIGYTIAIWKFGPPPDQGVR